MKVYCTTKHNEPPYYHRHPNEMIYLGASIKDAEEAIGEGFKYFKEALPVNYLEHYCVLPKDVVDWELIQFYSSNGFWFYSIVMFDLEET